MKSLRKILLAFVFPSFFCLSTNAEALDVIVRDTAGQPLENVAVAFYADASQPVSPDDSAEVIQWNRTFNPYLIVVPAGSTVNFPNRDTERHHVYSFSKAKQFELPLYHGNSEPVVFDKPGIVSLGCNIHDWMLAYVVVVDTPYYAQTNAAGVAKLENLPSGDYTVKYWAPGLNSEDLLSADTKASAAQSEYSIVLQQGIVKKRPQKPGSSHGGSSNY